MYLTQYLLAINILSMVLICYLCVITHNKLINSIDSILKIHKNRFNTEKINRIHCEILTYMLYLYILIFILVYNISLICHNLNL